MVLLDELGADVVKLILLDVSMPRVSGPRLLPELRRKAPACTVVFFTGNADGNETGDADGCSEKPATAAALLETVREVLDRRDASS